MLVADTGGDDMQAAVAATPEMAHDVMALRGNPVAFVPRPRLKRPWVESTIPNTIEYRFPYLFALTPAGTLVLSGGGVSRGGSLIGPYGLVLKAQVASRVVRRHRLLVLTATPSKENLAAIKELTESGKVAPVIDRTYPLNEVPEAIRYLEVEHARPKVVITV